MTAKFNTQFFLILLPLFFVCCGLTVIAQDDKYERRDFCSDYSYSNGKQRSFRETRETTVAAGGAINVDARRNGGISVKGENRADVLVRACIQTMGKTDAEAESLAKNIRIETNSTIHAENSSDESNWSVSYEILVPHTTDLNLTAYNGGIAISSVEGNIQFQTKNGGVSIRDAAGNVKGGTQNGGVTVALSGNAWRGTGLDVETKNGGVNLQLPENYAAHIETGTVNGGFHSSIAGISVPEDDYRTGRIAKKRISTDLNGGGAPIRVITTNGGVTVSGALVKVI